MPYRQSANDRGTPNYLGREVYVQCWVNDDLNIEILLAGGLGIFFRNARSIPDASDPKYS
jgi:hypothetical protein